MSEETKVLYYVLWLMHPVLQVGIVGFMLQRRLLHNFRFFFAYILTQLVTFAVVFPAFVWRSYDALFMLYWCANAISVTFGFLVIHEIFVDVFRMFHTLRDLGTVFSFIRHPSDHCPRRNAAPSALRNSPASKIGG